MSTKKISDYIDTRFINRDIILNDNYKNEIKKEIDMIEKYTNVITMIRNDNFEDKKFILSYKNIHNNLFAIINSLVNFLNYQDESNQNQEKISPIPKHWYLYGLLYGLFTGEINTLELSSKTLETLETLKILDKCDKIMRKYFKKFALENNNENFTTFKKNICQRISLEEKKNIYDDCSEYNLRELSKIVKKSCSMINIQNNIQTKKQQEQQNQKGGRSLKMIEEECKNQSWCDFLFYCTALKNEYPINKLKTVLEEFYGYLAFSHYENIMNINYRLCLKMVEIRKKIKNMNHQNKNNQLITLRNNLNNFNKIQTELSKVINASKNLLPMPINRLINIKQNNQNKQNIQQEYNEPNNTDPKYCEKYKIQGGGNDRVNKINKLLEKLTLLPKQYIYFYDKAESDNILTLLLKLKNENSNNKEIKQKLIDNIIKRLVPGDKIISIFPGEEIAAEQVASLLVV